MLQFDDILAALCTEVKPFHPNDHQKVYILSTDVEAKLAFDVLIAFGVNAKIYHTPEKPSKLYIPTLSDLAITAEELEQRLSAALAYAHALKSIKFSLDELCAGDASLLKPSGFIMVFVNAQPSGKQILIQLSQAKRNTAVAPAPANTPPPDTAPAAPVAVAAKSSSLASKPVTASSPRVVKKARKKVVNELTSGPVVGRGLLGKASVESGPYKETLLKRIMLRIFGNFSTSGYFTLLWLVVAGVLFSFFVFAKSFICYDFVAKKNTAWYCQDQAAIEAAKETRQKELQERLERLGLAPVPQQ